MLEQDFEQSVGYWAHMLSRAFERALNEELKPLGITLRQCQVLGCLAMGVLGALFALHRGREEWRLLLLVGLLGGFTTFSSFAFETLGLAEDGSRGRALSNLLLTNALCLLAVWLGYRATQRWYGI